MIVAAQSVKLSNQQKIAIETQKGNLEKIATKYSNIQDDLYHALFQEFQSNLPEWEAELERATLTFRFKKIDIFFSPPQYRGDPLGYQVKDEFKQILRIFFPRYVKILTQPQFWGYVEEIRIEGHTSAEWIGAMNDDEPYYLSNYK